MQSLKCGQVGYAIAGTTRYRLMARFRLDDHKLHVLLALSGIKNSREVRPGDTFYTVDEKDKPVANPDYIEPLPGFKPAKSMV
jgi:hypothetical protein